MSAGARNMDAIKTTFPDNVRRPRHDGDAIKASHVLVFVFAGILLASGLGGMLGAAQAQTPRVAQGTSLGVVTIEQNGALSNPSAPITVSGNTYTFTGTLYGSLVVLANNVVVDGAGHIVNYTQNEPHGDGAGVSVNATTGDTVKDLTIVNMTGTGVQANSTTGVDIYDVASSGLGTGALVENSMSAMVQGNAFVHGDFGVAIENVEGASVNGNNVSLGHFGVYVLNSSNVNVSDNQGARSETGAYVVGGSYVTLYGNTFENETNGAIVLYGSSSTNVTMNDGYGSFIGLEGEYDNGASFFDNQASGTEVGVLWLVSHGVSVVDNVVNAAHVGYESDESSALEYRGNTGVHDLYGIADIESNGVLVANSNLFNATKDGVISEDSSNITYLDNNVSQTYWGINTIGDSDVTATGNIATHTNYGVAFNQSRVEVTAVDNEISNSDYGVWVYDTLASANITGNDLQNDTAAVYVDELLGVLTVTSNDANHSLDGVYAEDVEGSVVVVGNELMDMGSFGVVAAEVLNSATIAANEIMNAGEVGVVTEEVEGPLMITGNDVQNSSLAGVAAQKDEGSDTIADNQAQDSGNYAIFEDDNEGSGVTIQDNNASGSRISLNITGGGSNAYNVVGNDLSRSTFVEIFDAVMIGSFSDNDMLDLTHIYINNTEVYSFYHNDIESSAFLLWKSADPGTIYGGWNALYPVGGNYWTGYTGVDRFSGSSQNIPGSDGIGDTPYYINGTEDQYPLMHAWFTPTVTFVESGLPSGSPWYVTFNGTEVAETAGNDISFPQVNGAWTNVSYMVDPVPGYVASPASGIVTEHGADITVDVSFVPFDFTVDFVETGLPAGTTWSVTVGASEISSGTDTVSFQLTNGTYDYSVTGVPGYTTSWSGTFTVNGADVSMPVDFLPVTYEVSFIETGLPAGTLWTLTLNGGPSSSSINTISFEVQNGTYSYNSGNLTGYVTPASGSVIIDGMGTAIALPYHPVDTFAVAVSESGLPAGTAWSASLGSFRENGTGSTLLFQVPNGTYAFSAAASGFNLGGQGNVNVSGKNFAISVTFTKPVFEVVFTETGLPAGTAWYASVGSTTVESSTSTAVLNLANGSYTYTVGASGAYKVSPATGTADVTGSMVNVAVSFSAVSTSPQNTTGSQSSQGFSNTEGYMLIIAVIVVAVVAAIGWLLYIRRKPGTGPALAGPPPQSSAPPAPPPQPAQPMLPTPPPPPPPPPS
jgi:nitrous oxidase accessory protein NosD